MSLFGCARGLGGLGGLGGPRYITEEKVFGLQSHHSLLFLFINFFYPFVDLLSQSTTKSLGNQTVPREFILSYTFVVVFSAVQMLKIMEKI